LPKGRAGWFCLFFVSLATPFGLFFFHKKSHKKRIHRCDIRMDAASIRDNRKNGYADLQVFQKISNRVAAE